jgi:protein MpaA
MNRKTAPWVKLDHHHDQMITRSRRGMRAPIRITAVALVGAVIGIVATLVSLPANAGTAASAELTRELIGHSVRGRAIYTYECGDPLGEPAIVVGSIHGNEPGGISIAKRLLRSRVPDGVDLWVIPDLNPDGHAAHTRGNAHGVDLNRNFPRRWRRLSGGNYSGRRPLSEPESRAVARLVERIRPRLSIWFHQPLDLVDGSRRSPRARRFARLSGLPLRRLPTYPGTVTSWERKIVPGSVAFVVELPAGRPGKYSASRYARAMLAVSPDG